MAISDLWTRRKKSPRFECHLQEFREATGTSLEELAEHCKVSVETIEQIENAEYEPSIVLAEHIAQRLHTPVESLFTAHPPVPVSAAEEERFQRQVSNISYWLFSSFFFSMLVAVIVVSILGYQDAAMALFITWAAGAVGLIVAASFIPGYWRSLRYQSPFQSKPRFWFNVIASPILYASLMELLPSHSGEAPLKRILSFLFFAVFWAVWNYWFRIRKMKPIAK
ncbi:MAG TPA: helix-turn-helix domain-containing protein [Candidatus Kapabacteria bacterium]|jgi:putative transcriptional regulator